MYLSALSIGKPIDGIQGQAKVHSIFEHACNLQLASEDIVTLLVKEAGNQPQGIRLETADGFSFYEQALASGQAVTISQSQQINIPQADVTIGLQAAHPWVSRLPVMDLTAQPVLDALQAAHTELGVPVLEHGYQQQLIDSLARLADAAVRYAHMDAVEAAKPMIGLGPGVTPSGDDMLIGFVTAVRSVGYQQFFTDDLCKRLLPLLPKTNDISQTFLRYAFKRSVSEWIIKPLQAIRKGNIALTQHTVQQAVTIGHTSGRDTMRGLLVGLDSQVKVIGNA